MYIYIYIYTICILYIYGYGSKPPGYFRALFTAGRCARSFQVVPGRNQCVAIHRPCCKAMAAALWTDLKGPDSCGDSCGGFPWPWGYPNSWMVYIMDDL